jgi:hypothetical protein
VRVLISSVAACALLISITACSSAPEQAGGLQILEHEALPRTIVLREDDRPAFAISYPADWKVTMERHRITSMTEDGLLWSSLSMRDGITNLADAEREAREVVGAELQGVTFDETHVEEEGRIPARVISGRGQRNGRDLVFAAVVFHFDAERIAAILFLGDPAVENLYPQTIKDVCGSIRVASELASGL